MPSERIPERLRRPLLILATSGAVLVTWAMVHLGMHALALHFESHGTPLWWREQHMRLFMGSNYVERQNPRILFTGSSETREALIDSELRERLPGWETNQHAWIWATLDELVTFLEYVERAHGDFAVPEAVVVGITPRFISGQREFPSPFYDAIDRYSPHFRVDRESDGALLVEKGFLASLRARMAYVKQQGNRYRSASKAVARAALVELAPWLDDNGELRTRLITNGFHHLADWTAERKRDFFEAPDRLDPRFDGVIQSARKAHAWDPGQSEAQIVVCFDALLEILERHGARLLLVNMPEISMSRAGYDSEHYRRYLSIARAAARDAPLLDLSDFLADEEFYDHQHANRAGAQRISKEVAAFLRTELRSP